MPDAWIDQEAIKNALGTFFDDNSGDMNVFGRTVNQTFEAFVFAAVIAWYRDKGWDVKFHHPRRTAVGGGHGGGVPSRIQLKFSTRGRPQNYSYVVCKRKDQEVHVRHQLRVATKYHTKSLKCPANVCLDVAVIKAIDLSGFKSDDYVASNHLITFGEAKHMSAFAELVANFVGLVHEMQPSRLRRIRKDGYKHGEDLPPFLYVSGFLFRTAQGIEASVIKRGYDIDVYSRTQALAKTVNLPSKAAPKRTRKKFDKRVSKEDVERLPF